MKKLRTKKSVNSRTANLLIQQEIIEMVMYIINDIKGWLLPLFIDRASYQVNPVNFKEDILYSPYTKIEYHRIYDVYNNVPVTIFSKAFLRNGHPIWITWSFVSNVSIMLTVYDQHFFLRYAERMGIGFSPTLIADYCLNHQSLCFIRNSSSDTSSEDVMCKIDEGIILGKRIAPNIVLAKTFVSYDMAFQDQLPEPIVDIEEMEVSNEGE